MNKNIIKTVILSGFLTLFCVLIACSCFAQESNKPQDTANKVTLTAEIPDIIAVKSDIDKRVLKKYYPIRLSIKNNDKRTLDTGERIFYTDNKGENHKIYGYKHVYENTKLNSANRAILVGIPVTILTFGILTLPITAVSVTHSTTTNENLESNLMKNTFRTRHLFKDDVYTAMIFIPKSEKDVSQVIIKDTRFDDGETLDLTAKVTNENL